MSKRFLAILLVVVMVFSMLTVASAAGSVFSDVSADAWYADEVNWAYEKGLMDGTDTATFAPNGTLTRGMIVTVLWRLEGKPVVNYAMTFEDVAADQWYTEAVRWAAAVGIVDGYSETAYGPNDTLNREQLATILWRYAKLNDIDVSADDTDISGYTDFENVSDWAVEAMQWACSVGLINGVTDSTIDPAGAATRAQTAVILYRFHEEVINVTPDEPDEPNTPSGGNGGSGSGGGGGGYVPPVTPPHEHEYTYTSNNDGTHNGACECGEDALTNESCEYENDVCTYCGYEPAAKIGTAYYYTLEDAIAVVEDNGTIVLLKNNSETGIVVGREVSFSIDNGTYTYSPEEITAANACYSLSVSAEVFDFDLDHAYTYDSNDNGTHNGTCACGGNVITNKDCTIVDGKCVNCGYIAYIPVVVDTTEELQAALDAATDGTVIQLVENVTYDVVYVGRPTEYNETEMYCGTHDFTTTDATEFAAHLADGNWHTTPKYTTTLNNVTIVGAEGATIAGVVATSGHAHGEVHDYVLDKDVSGSAYYNTLNIENLKFSSVAFTGKVDINTSDADSVYNGVTFEGCTFTTGGTASANGPAIRYYNEANNGKVKNFVVNNCTFTNCYQGVYAHHVNGVTVTNSTFTTTGHNAIALQGHDGAVNFGTVVISGNTFENIGDRVIRFNEIGADSTITIKNNVATNSGDEDGEVMKATSIADVEDITLSGNTWDGYADAELGYTDGVWSLPVAVNTTEDLQAALDAATDGTVIQLVENVTYDVVYVGRPTKYNDTEMYCGTHAFTTTDAAEFAAHLADGNWHTTPKYTTTLNNVTIVGAEGATIAGVVATSGHAHGEVHDYVLDKDVSGSAYYNTLNIENLTFSGVAFTGTVNINTADASSVYDGVTFEGCTFTTGGTASANGPAIRYYNEANNGNVKNIVVDDCDFTNCYQGIYTAHVNGITVTNSTFDKTGHNAIAVQGSGAVDFGKVVITGNTFDKIGDRVIRFNEIGAGSEITIKDNMATDSGDEAGEVAKATSLADGGSVVLSGNSWNGVTDADAIATGKIVNLTYKAKIGTKGYATAQAALDVVKSGETVELAAGDHGVLYVGRPTKYNETEMYCETHSFTATDAAVFATHLADGQYHTTPRYTTTLNNVTIVGAEGAKIAGVVAESGHKYGDNVHDYVLDKDVSGSAYYNTLNIENLKFSGVAFTGKVDINTSDASSVYDGVTFEGCTFTTGGTASTNGAAIRYYNEYNNGNVKNLTVKTCQFNDCYQGVYTGNVNGITVTNSTFTKTGHNAIALQGAEPVNFGTVEISKNTFGQIGDRIIRFNHVGADSAITIENNVATNSGKTNGEIIKAESIADVEDITLSGNTWNGYPDEQIDYANGVWSIVGLPGTTLALVRTPSNPDSHGTIYVNSKEDLTNLSTLTDNWVARFSNGTGTDYTNYAPIQGGKGTDYYYDWTWNIKLTADIDFEGATIDPIELGKRNVFDGQGHTIKNAKIITDSTAENGAGLFVADQCGVKDLNLVNIQVTGSLIGNSTAGVLSGSCNKPVENITITSSSVYGGKYTGGVIGYGYSDVTNCTLNDVAVQGGYKLGGIIGYICASGTNTGEVTGNFLDGCTVDGIGNGTFAGGKTEYVVGKVVGNYNCNGTCNNNTVTNMITSATANIGKIEAGRDVTQ